MIGPLFFQQCLSSHGMDFYAGVPDSLLKNFCACLTDTIDARHHLIAANEGAAIGLAAGHYLATGRIPVVYMQNSGLGNTVNPLMSLMDKEVYNMPVLLLIGWRGEPGVKDEPQHVKQGKVTCSLLEAMNIRYEIMEMDETTLKGQIERVAEALYTTKEPFALVIRKGTFDSYALPEEKESLLELSREEAIREVAAHWNQNEVTVSTTGMISRELFEYREATGEGHGRDFLTVGSMGHASQIALGIALEQPERKVCCMDGDGASIMHMGSWAIIGQSAPANFYHILFNNGAHDSVGGQPTVGLHIDFPAIAIACGYKTVFSVTTRKELDEVLAQIDNCEAPVLLEIKVKKGARKDLGRPTTTPIENKESLMKLLNEKKSF